MVELLLKEEVYAVVGAAIEVHRELGSGFLEPVYQEAMEIEMTSRAIPFHAQKALNIRYKDRVLVKNVSHNPRMPPFRKRVFTGYGISSEQYMPDLICCDQIIVELKALSHLSGAEESLWLNYLKASGLRVGLLINFGSHGKLEWKRYVR